MITSITSMKFPLSILIILLGSLKVSAYEKPHQSEEKPTFRQKMRDMENRYNSLGRRLDSLILKTEDHAPQQTVVPTGAYNSAVYVDEKVPHPHQQSQQIETKQITTHQDDKSWFPLNSISISYGLCIPHDTKYQTLELENDNGYQLQMAYFRNFRNFLLGFKIDTKFYETSGVKLSGYTFKDGVSGNNFLIQGAFNFGKDYFFNDYFFTRNLVSIGVSYTDNQFQLSLGYPRNEDSTQIIGGLRTGLGIQLHENFSALFYYQLDAIPSRKSWGSQFFSHFGISGNIKY
jgi:hypothetical protein